MNKYIVNKSSNPLNEFKDTNISTRKNQPYKYVLDTLVNKII